MLGLWSLKVKCLMKLFSPNLLIPLQFMRRYIIQITSSRGVDAISSLLAFILDPLGIVLSFFTFCNPLKEQPNLIAPFSLS